MYILIIALPLISAAIAGLAGRKIGEKGAGIITTCLILTTSFLSMIVLYEVGFAGAPTYVDIWKWIESGAFSIRFGLMYDTVTAMMLFLVTSVSALVHMYSIEYMNGDPHKPRFMSYLSLFTFFMIVLVTSDNLLQLFIGWEGVGLCSYLLINFWYTRIQANKAAIKAMLMNRVGDVGLTLAMFVGYKLFGSVDFSVMFAMAPMISAADINLLIFGYEFHGLTLMACLLLIGAVGKSAQIILHTWLPDAMEGPTPVSALIHAATMVTAGVFLLVRCSPIIEYAPTGLIGITIIGSITALFAATIGLVQNDIKKVIAYSTCSQLGYMVFACGISNYSASLFHLVNHGFFKALLFLSAGSVIHAMADEQDMRKFGGLIKQIPFTYAMILIGSLSLMGTPFLTGFYSKDAILELAFAKYTISSNFAHWLGTIAAFFTAFYSFRLIYLTFITNTNANIKTFEGAHESPWQMSVPLVILGFGSIFFGYIFRDAVIGPGTDFFGASIFIHPVNNNLISAEFLPAFYKWIPVIFSISGAVLAFVLYFSFMPHIINFKLSSVGIRIYTFLSNKWHWDYIYAYYIAKPSLAFGHNISYKLLDRGLIEYIGPHGLVVGPIKNLAKFSAYIQSGLTYDYSLWIFTFLFSLVSGFISYHLFQNDLDLFIIFPLLLFFVPKKLI